MPPPQAAALAAVVVAVAVAVAEVAVDLPHLLVAPVAEIQKPTWSELRAGLVSQQAGGRHV